MPPAPPARAAAVPKGKRVKIRVDRHRLRLGGQLRVTGKVRGGVAAGAHVRVLARTKHGQWRRLRRKPVNADGTFGTWPRLLRSVSISRAGRVHRLALRGLHLGRHTRLIRIRAVVTRAGRSNVVRVRIVPRRAHSAHSKRKAAAHHKRKAKQRKGAQHRKRHHKHTHHKRAHHPRVEHFSYA